MSLRRIAHRTLPALLLGTLFTGQLFARIVQYPGYPLKVQVLSSEFIPADAAAEFPKDCDLKNYSDACANGKTPAGKVILQVEDDWVRKYDITCEADASWSNCSPLPVKSSYQAHRHSNGITLLTPGASGEKQPHFYPFSGAAVRAAKPRATRKPAAAEPPQEQAATASAPAAEAESAPTAARILCRFRSNPDGAEIQIDGRYSGNTPSEIGLSAGTHKIVISMAGYGEWKRELTLTADSTVNVLANLEK